MGSGTVWSELAADAAGVLLFVLWLALPPLYLIVLGRLYVRRCELTYRVLRDYGCKCDCCCPWDEPTQEIAAVEESPAYGRHALRR
jgi:hypothetical protein